MSSAHAPDCNSHQQQQTRAAGAATCCTVAAVGRKFSTPAGSHYWKPPSKTIPPTIPSAPRMAKDAPSKVPIVGWSNQLPLKVEWKMRPPLPFSHYTHMHTRTHSVDMCLFHMFSPGRSRCEINVLPVTDDCRGRVPQHWDRSSTWRHAKGLDDSPLTCPTIMCVGVPALERATSCVLCCGIVIFVMQRSTFRWIDS